MQLEAQSGHSRIFKASRYWTSNVWGAALAGFGVAILLSVMMGIVLWHTHAWQVILWVVGIYFVITAALLYIFPGNGIAAYPYAVEIEEGKGLRLYAPWKKIYLPIEDVRDVRWSFFGQAFVVRLNRRHRVLRRFIIHRFFGSEGESLADAIQEEIRRRAS